VEPEFRGQRAGCDVVRATEGGKEVVERVLVSDIDGSQGKTPSVMIAFEQVVVTDGNIEQAAGRDARRPVVIIFSPWRGHGYQRRAELGGETGKRQGHSRRGTRAVASKPSLELLIGGKRCPEGICHVNGGLSAQRG